MLWIDPQVNQRQTRALQQRLAISPVLAALLVRLGLHEPMRAHAFLHPRLKDLDDPFHITHLEQAVERLLCAIQAKESVLVLGDYDVDGITSAALLIETLSFWGSPVRYAVPRRLQEGYGLTPKLLERVLADGNPDLFVAVDCGTNAGETIALLRERGIDVLVIDHHQSKEPQFQRQGSILVNPHVFDDDQAPWYNLCTVGLVFKLVHGLLKKMREAGDQRAWSLDLRDSLDLVALGTVADLVPLRGENRILTQAGLKRLQKPRRMGLQALYQASGLKEPANLSSFDIAFKLGPRINAGGRLADAALATELLLGQDWSTCLHSAQQINAFNQQRQRIEEHITAEAERQIEAQPPDTLGYVLCDPGWHLGVVGVIASRIVQKYYRPCLVLGAQGDMAQGSGRSIPGIDLIQVLRQCLPWLERCGGHPMAVGLALPLSRLDQLRTVFIEAIAKVMQNKRPQKTLDIAQWLTPEQAWTW